MSDAPLELAGLRLEQRIGQGGMGEVWRAVRPADGARFAVKVLSLPAADLSGRVRRFETEAEIGSRLTHPNLVRVHGHGTQGASSTW
ncbi:MAG: protein kinase [Archangiaceae bacterium]|nr:protein kinase [Archangiaceae bacterium]